MSLLTNTILSISLMSNPGLTKAEPYKLTCTRSQLMQDHTLVLVVLTQTIHSQGMYTPRPLD